MHPLGTEKNSREFFAASPSGESTVPAGKGWLEKNGSFFAIREGVTLIIASEGTIQKMSGLR
jgi:hypothetical protein